MTQLTENFRLDEFTSSQTATRMGREIVAPPDVEANLKRLCEMILEPARVLLGRPFVITSGFRPPWLNTLIGGSKTSAHMEGRAADIQIVGMSSPAFAGWLNRRGYPIDQIIEEGNWVHVGIAKLGEKPRNQYLTATFAGGVATYTRAA